LIHKRIADVCAGYGRGVPRLPRYLLPAEGIYHVTARGVARSAISRDDGDRRLFLVLLAREVARETWDCHVFCLMPNHYHLIVDTTLERLSRGLHRLNSVLAQSFNQRHRRSGHLFGDRFAALAIRDDEHLHNASEYVLNNPVRAGLCERPEDWPWSGSR
jgi:REP element-mobilizing transposase RayT